MQIEKTKSAWSSLSDVVHVPHGESDYRELVDLLDQLADEVSENESHPLASLMELIGVFVQRYEDENVPELR
jgi:HTH-type transcriptional regulator/antitoxin HigA